MKIIYEITRIYEKELNVEELALIAENLGIENDEEAVEEELGIRWIDINENLKDIIKNCKIEEEECNLLGVNECW